MKIYISDLADLPREDLAIAFQRARRELKWFPKIAELRHFASGNDEEREALRLELEAENAWQLVERDLSHCGRFAPPHLDARTEYAIRVAGGRTGINACYAGSLADEAFTKRRFMEAFKNFDKAEQLGLQLPAALADKFKLLAKSREMRALEKPKRRPLKPSAL